MTRRSGRPQHLCPGHLGAVMAWYSSSVCSIPCLDQALSRFQQVDQRGGTLEGAPTGLGAPLAYQVPTLRASTAAKYPSTRTGPKL